MLNIALISLLLTGLGVQPDVQPDPEPHSWPSLLLVDPDQKPTVTIAYWDVDGRHEFTGTRPYESDASRLPLGANIDAFVAAGGNRVTKSAAHPRGSVVRAGFYRTEAGIPWFPQIDTDHMIEVTLDGVFFNQPVDAYAESVVQHLKYSPDDLESCGLPSDARVCFNMTSMTDILNENVVPGTNARMGALGEAGPGSTEVVVNENGSVRMTVRFPYSILRNLRDPWESELPGTFLEPAHFHLEFEALPEGVEPLDHVERLRLKKAARERFEREGPFSVPSDVKSVDDVTPEGQSEPAPEDETETET